MKQLPYFRIFCGISLLCIMFACQPAKNLAKDQLLYNKNRIKFSKKHKIENLKTLRQELKSQLPATNNPIKLWLYNLAGHPDKENGLRSWIRNKLGEPPQIYRKSQDEQSRIRMVQLLKKYGYFEGRIQIDTQLNGKRLTSNYYIESESRYKLRNVFWPEANGPLFSHLMKYRSQSELKPGNYYQQEDLVKERNRIAEWISNEGYFRFLPSYIYYYVDTLDGMNELDIYMHLQSSSTDSSFLEPHFLANTWIYDPYDILNPDGPLEGRHLYAPVKELNGHPGSVKLKVLQRTVLQDKKDPFSLKLENQSINRVLDLGVFKFVNIKYDVFYQRDTYWLDRNIFLTPALPKNIGVDLDINTRSGNFLGSSMATYYQNKNAWLGAENLIIRVSGGMETQIGVDLPAINSLEWKVEGQLELPKILLLPRFFSKQTSTVPKTRLKLGNHFQRRPGFFTFNSLNLGLDYYWGEVNRSNHSLGLISISHNQTFKTHEDFEEKLETSPRLKSSFSDIFIIGTYYQLQLHKGNPQGMGNASFLKARLESAGNLLYIFSRINKSNGPPFTLFQLPFSQFLKADLDYRFYRRKKRSTWVFRGIAGMVIPYGNANYAPYVKQYFAGGSNDNRAFRIRSVGPGSVAEISNTETRDYFDQTGEVKLGFNMEYRHPLIRYLKGAVFLDGGNIWLLKAQPDDPENGVIKLNRFYKEIALGTGVGLRLDLNFFVLRVDMAFPIYNPGFPLGSRWQLNKIQLFNPSWRKQNLLWNVAIGYPF